MNPGLAKQNAQAKVMQVYRAAVVPTEGLSSGGLSGAREEGSLCHLLTSIGLRKSELRKVGTALGFSDPRGAKHSLTELQAPFKADVNTCKPLALP